MGEPTLANEQRDRSLLDLSKPSEVQESAESPVEFSTQPEQASSIDVNPAEAAEVEASSPLLTRGDRLFLCLSGGGLFLLLSVQWVLMLPHGTESISLERGLRNGYQYQLEINQATWIEWMQLEGIGELTARKIVADREERGAFRSIEDVRRVPGIGVKTMEKIRPLLLCSECPSTSSESSPIRPVCDAKN